MAKRLPPDRNRRAKAYRDFLLQYNRLTDRAWYEGHDGDRLRRPNTVLEYRRNGNYKWPVCSVPSLVKIDAHLNRFEPGGRKHDTIFFMNDCSFPTLMCLIDIDTEDNPPAAQALAEHVAKRWLNEQAVIDVSPGGKGRHIYFPVSTFYDPMSHFHGKEIRALLLALKKIIQNDPAVQSFQGARVCSVQGAPTYWRKHHLWYVDYRGSVVKAPYFHGDVEGGMKQFDGLKPFSLLDLHNALVKRANRRVVAKASPASVYTSSLSFCEKTYMGVTTPPTNLQDLDGPAKKRLCVTTLCRYLNRPVTVEEALAEYHAHYQPTGSSENDLARRQREMAEVVNYFNPTFRPASGSGKHQFSRSGYLEVCKRLVPPTAFAWKRREKLDHQRLADLVSIKIQDAFFRKDRWMARASRNATIKNMRVLKAKGMVDWVVNNHTYRRLLDIAVAYGLLHVYDEYTQPVRDDDGVRLAKGAARMIGPGKALEEEWKAFQPIYEADRKKSAIPDFLLD